MSTMSESTGKPIIKWVGGKRKLIPELLDRIPNRKALESGEARYIEPFIGGGALFFRLRSLFPSMPATINDFNPELANLYWVIQQAPDTLARELSEGGYEADPDVFRQIRALDRAERWPATCSDIKRAARFLYLNKTAFNGLWRVNAKGQFNVPYGHYKAVTLPDVALLRAYSVALNGAEILHGDFEDAVTGSAKTGDLVYFDPPYAPISETSAFTSYTKDGFGDDMQHRLASLLQRLSEQGTHWMLSNSDTPFTRDVFGKCGTVHTVQMARSINSKGDGRGKVNEILVVSDL